MAYEISTYAQLKAISPTHLADDCVLLANIDASDSETEDLSGDTYQGFAPIGASGTEFTGTFDGDNFTISNLYINRSTTDYVGLFGKVLKSAGVIKDVVLTNFTITGQNYVGLLAGKIEGGASDCAVSGITADGVITSTGSAIGGLIGATVSATISDSFADTTITDTVTSATEIGGFIGGCTNTDCTATCGANGIITIAGSSSVKVGGFVGSPSSTASNFTSCYSTVAIISNLISSGAFATSIGGFVGYNDGGIMTLCAALGSIITIDTYAVYAGGFAGYSTGTITKCYAAGDVDATAATTSSNMGGFVGVNSCTAINNCYSRGDVGKLGISTGTYVIGGFTGNVPVGITIGQCYSTGYVNQSAGSVGGFCASGTASKSQVTCLWDTDTSGILTSFGTSPAVGKTTAELILQATTDDAPFNFDYATVWQMSVDVTSAVDASNLTVWLSATGDYEKFEAGTKDADSFQLVIPSTNEIRWIESMNSLVVGTSGDEWQIASNKLGTPLTPTNFGVKRQTNYGSALLQAIRVNEVILFVDYVRRKLREMSYDINAEKFTCPDMTSLAEHITQGQIEWIAYQRNPDSILWVGLKTGEIKAFVYDREQNVLAWSNIVLGEGGLAQSGCVIPGETEDIIYLAVNRTIPGSQVYSGTEPVYSGTEPVVKGSGDRVFIEKFAPRLFTTAASAFFVDCGITFTSPGEYVSENVYSGDQPVVSATEQVIKTSFDTTAPTATITGLDHFNGHAVQVLGDGIRLDDEIVSDGQITASSPVFTAQIGVGSTATIQPMRIVMGDSHGKNTKVNQLVISFMNTGAAKYGKSLDNMLEIDFTDVRWTNSCEIAGLFTGEVTVETAGGFDPLNPIFIQSSGPSPITVRAIIPDIDRTG